MRKLLFILLASAALASCSKDPNLVTNEALDGTWNVTAYTIDAQDVYGPEGILDDGSFVFSMVDDFSGNSTTTFTFFPGSEFETTESENGTYVVSQEGTIVTITDSEGESIEATVTIEASTVTMVYVEDNQTHNVTAEKQ